MRASRTEIPQHILSEARMQVTEEPKATVTAAPTVPEASVSRDENRRMTAPAGAKLRRAIDVLWEFGCCLDMVFYSSGERGFAKKRRPASFIPARRLQAALQNRFRRPAAGATAGSCFLL